MASESNSNLGIDTRFRYKVLVLIWGDLRSLAASGT